MRILARGLDSTDRAQRGPYKKDLGPIFSQVQSGAMLVNKRFIIAELRRPEGPPSGAP